MNILQFFKPWWLAIIRYSYRFYNKYLLSDKILLGNGRIYSRSDIRKSIHSYKKNKYVLEHPTHTNIDVTHKFN